MRKESYYSVNVYENDEETVDFIESCKGEKYAKIDYIEVAKKERGKGVGRRLLKEAITEAKATGLEVYIVAEEIDADTEIDRLVSFYESEGFRVDSEAGSAVVMKL